MNESLEKIVVFIVAIIISITFVAFMAKVITYSDKSSEEYRQKNIQEINECLDKTSDRDWCFNKFLK